MNKLKKNDICFYFSNNVPMYFLFKVTEDDLEPKWKPYEIYIYWGKPCDQSMLFNVNKPITSRLRYESAIGKTCIIGPHNIIKHFFSGKVNWNVYK